MIKKAAQKIGIDGAIGYTVLARMIQAGGGLITLALIAIFLSKEQQGYYYTFGSIVAIQIFFELGLNSIITQYVAHEIVHLEWGSETELIGSKEHLSRLSSLLHFCLRVFGVLAIVLFFVLLISGFVFFTKYHVGKELVNWKFPWILITFSTSIMLVINPFLAFLEGLGKVKEVAKIRFVQQILNISVIAIVFLLKGGLLALGLASLASFIFLLASIFFSYRKKLFILIYESKEKWKVDYWKEIFPYQYKIALSWISGFFIFQLFNPVLFATEGPIVAGQMGMTLQALNGISALSMSWISTKVPLFSSLIAQRNFKKLDDYFNKAVLQLTIVNFCLLISFIVFVFALNFYFF